MEIKIKKLVPEAIIPTYSKEGDAGMDLTGIEILDHPDYIQYSTGLAIAIPVGYVGLIFPRSSISKYDLILANSVGVIDSGYRGEILVRFKRTQSYYRACKSFVKNERIAQLIIIPIPDINYKEVEELDETKRGDGGFGSTGNK